VISFDEAAFLERTHASQARRRRDTGAARQLDVGHTAIRLEIF
jgi:hypothetical protein